MSMRCAIVTSGGDVGADLQSMVVGTATEVDAAAVARLRVGPIVETIPLACVVASKFAAPTNVQLRIAGTETERVG